MDRGLTIVLGSTKVVCNLELHGEDGTQKQGTSSLGALKDGNETYLRLAKLSPGGSAERDSVLKCLLDTQSSLHSLPFYCGPF